MISENCHLFFQKNLNFNFKDPKYFLAIMGRARQTKKFATMKRMISASDPRLKDKDRAAPKKKKAEDPNEIKTTEHVQQSSALFFQYNTQLGPPFHVLIDTNFINFSIKNKMDIIQSMMDCLYAKCIPYITGIFKFEIIAWTILSHVLF